MCSPGRWNVTDVKRPPIPTAALRKPTPRGSFAQSPRPRGHDARTNAEATSFGSALTMRGAAISAPAADMALVLSDTGRDGLRNVIGFAPSQPAFKPTSKRCARCAHFA